MYTYNCSLIRVLDGDTVDAMIDLGFDIHIKKRIRLIGIDAPETRTKDLEEKARGVTAKCRLMELLDSVDGVFKLNSHGVGKFGRCLGEIYTSEKTISLNIQLVQENLVDVYDQ